MSLAPEHGHMESIPSLMVNDVSLSVAGNGSTIQGDANSGDGGVAQAEAKDAARFLDAADRAASRGYTNFYYTRPPGIEAARGGIALRSTRDALASTRARVDPSPGSRPLHTVAVVIGLGTFVVIGLAVVSWLLPGALGPGAAPFAPSFVGLVALVTAGLAATGLAAIALANWLAAERDHQRAVHAASAADAAHGLMADLEARLVNRLRTLRDDDPVQLAVVARAAGAPPRTLRDWYDALLIVEPELAEATDVALEGLGVAELAASVPRWGRPGGRREGERR